MFRFLLMTLVIYLTWLGLAALGNMLSVDSTNDVIRYLGIAITDLMFAGLLILAEILRTLIMFFSRFRFNYDEEFDSMADSEGGTAS